MPIGLTEEHDALRQAVRRFVETRIPPAVTRAALDAERDDRPEFWTALAEPGWLGLHVDEAHGGAGYGYVEQAVVLEELGRAAAPGPYLPTVLAAAVLQDAGGPAAAEWLPQLGVRYRDRGRRPHRLGAGARRDARGRRRGRGRRRVVRAAGRGREGHRVQERRPDPARGPHRRRGVGGPRRAAARDHDRRACTRSPRCSSPPKPSASRNGASTPRPSTRRCACSSAARSVSSKA